MPTTIKLTILTILTAAVVLAGSVFQAMAQTLVPVDDSKNLAAGFSEPPMTAWPRVYWFWMGTNVSKEGIVADLEAMREAGIGGLIQMAIPDSVGSWDMFEIVDSPTPDHRVLSKKWWELLAFAVNEAGRRDMFFDLHVCPGYATCGGPWITPENSMQLLTFSHVELDGAEPATITLPRPAVKPVVHWSYDNTTTGPKQFKRTRVTYDTKGFYGDVGVVAVPKADSSRPDFARGVDVTRHMRPNGTLDWHPPGRGAWVVYRIGHHSSGRCIAPAPPQARGLEADKWSDRALENSYRAFSGKLLGMLDAEGRKALQSVHIDSFEAGPQNWTATFREDFRQRRGYDPLPFLPLLSVNRKKIKDDRAQRFLYDFECTKIELFAERMIGRSAELAHRDGLQFSCEPYGGDLDPVELVPHVDQPIDTFCNRPPGRTFSLSATYAGKPLVGAEAFTTYPQNPGARWDATPMMFIPRAHGAFVRGINILYFHCYAHQPFPDSVKPGMTMGQWGTQIGRKTTWWKQSRPFFDYLARCQYLLQQGVRVMDALEMQYCPSEVFLNDLAVRDGRVTIPDGNSFAWIRLTKDRSMRLDVARRLEELVAAGAVVVGPKPHDAPGLEGYPDSVAEVRQIAARLWGNCDGKKIRRNRFGKGTVLWNENPAKVIAGYVPDFQVKDASPGARFAALHRRTPDAEIYFVANLTPHVASGVCCFRTVGRQPEFWDAADGSIRDAKQWQTGTRQIDVALELEGHHAIFVVFRKPTREQGPGIDLGKTATPATGPITKAVYGLPGTKKMVELTDKLNRLIGSGQTRLMVGHALGIDPAPYKVKTLEITYTTPGGQTKQIVAKDGDTIALPQVKKPALLRLDGAWEVSFPANLGAPERIALPELMNLSEHANSGVKYFSGTVTYRKEFSLSGAQLAKFPSSVVLDLGEVCHVVTVKLNGRELGILWRGPYRIEVTKFLRPGKNRLELDVTNTWVNRLIGDQQEPDDCTWYPDQRWARQNIGAPLRAFPDWFTDFLKTGNRPSKGRYTFVFWNKYKKDSPLPASGLIGPVVLRPAVGR